MASIMMSSIAKVLINLGLIFSISCSQINPSQFTRTLISSDWPNQPDTNQPQNSISKVLSSRVDLSSFTLLHNLTSESTPEPEGTLTQESTTGDEYIYLPLVIRGGEPIPADGPDLSISVPIKMLPSPQGKE